MGVGESSQTFSVTLQLLVQPGKPIQKTVSTARATMRRSVPCYCTTSQGLTKVYRAAAGHWFVLQQPHATPDNPH